MKGAKKLGYVFTGRTPHSVIIDAVSSRCAWHWLPSSCRAQMSPVWSLWVPLYRAFRMLYAKGFCRLGKVVLIYFYMQSPLPFCVAWAIGSCKIIWEMPAVVPEEYFPCLGSTDEHTRIRRKFMYLGDCLTIIFNGCCTSKCLIYCVKMEFFSWVRSSVEDICLTSSGCRGV